MLEVYLWRTRLIKDINDKVRTPVRNVGGDLKHFFIFRVNWLRQGSSFSPFLFVFMMDKLSSQIQGEMLSDPQFDGSNDSCMARDLHDKPSYDPIISIKVKFA